VIRTGSGHHGRVHKWKLWTSSHERGAARRSNLGSWASMTLRGFAQTPSKCYYQHPMVTRAHSAHGTNSLLHRVGGKMSHVTGSYSLFFCETQYKRIRSHVCTYTRPYHYTTSPNSPQTCWLGKHLTTTKGRSETGIADQPCRSLKVQPAKMIPDQHIVTGRLSA
jgi:hypothetical protein